MEEKKFPYIRLVKMVESEKAHSTSSLFRENKKPKLNKLIRYAEILEVPVWEFFVEKDFIPESSKTRRITSGAMSSDLNIGDRIKALMQEKGIINVQLAEKIGVSKAAISQNLKSENPTMSVLESFARGLDIEVWELFATPEEIRKARGCNDEELYNEEEAPEPVGKEDVKQAKGTSEKTSATDTETARPAIRHDFRCPCCGQPISILIGIDGKEELQPQANEESLFPAEETGKRKKPARKHTKKTELLAARWNAKNKQREDSSPVRMKSRNMGDNLFDPLDFGAL